MEKYTKLTDKDISFFEPIYGDRMLLDKEHITEYTHDETEDLQFYPAVVLKPINSQEISQTLEYCYNKSIPVTPAGARTGLSGGSLPVLGGVLLSCEKLNQIIAVGILTMFGILMKN